MGTGSDHAALVALLRAAKRAPSEYAELLESGTTPEQILQDEHGLLAPQLAEAARAEIESWRKRGIAVVSVLDPGYPPNLRSVHDRPALVFFAGTLRPEDARSVAVIGTRKPSPDGMNAARALSEHLVDGGFTVASGLAAGIDTVAHSSAIARGGRTVAVIGTGLLHSYPPENAPLQRQIAAEGAVISQFWPDTRPSRRTFPQRNAVMSGIALASILVEATHTSGARTQARLALAHGRPVLLMESLLDQNWVRDLAARPGTHVIRSPGEVMAVVERLSSTSALLG